ncbi:MAG: hypothetical protein ACLUHE_04870 [Christensenellales bacterium]
MFLARDYGQQSRTYSEDVAARIDAEVQRKMNDSCCARYGDPYRAPRPARRPSDPLVEKARPSIARNLWPSRKWRTLPRKNGKENVLKEPEQI